MTAGTNSSWRSPSGDFAFGFYRLVNGQFLVGIWFDNIPGRTLVWSANRDDPARAGSTINFTLDGRLGLTHSNGTGYLIYNGTFGASSALMQDDGNFVVKTNSSKGYLAEL
ncbi:G-TYPE LECTIN S-RECEPTOR-LIKE SERINE/THREONINE-PROTEIN KINASE SD2-5 [Salix koriyanagi]|uniref:G-TYPE LECTIN S-RECEPTOR-LIKE SERINE/THREONINE-PROTEIN KINASE SD2-5 n=1 Tax=Salix koriyanagi TaxID=2511006 RepID=A0A9Q1A4F1_9ROSI|nr:G-TYPE LECTIN S-RECEPTOR-LIKE SERINE/THREONINE-PROTEIN KINASE SD2-5 [Salix koriyanagi]